MPEVVVLAGGIGKRFKQADLNSPEKPLIKVHGASQIIWALLGVTHSYPGSRIYIASRSALVESLKTEVERIMPGLITEFVDIGQATLGAAHSLKLFIENSKMLNRDLQVISCDNDCFSIVSLSKKPNFVSVMESMNPGHCFVSKNEDGYIKDLYEKTVVGTLALSGHYGFETSMAYLNFYKDTKFGDSEFFLSTVVSQAVGNSVEFEAVICNDYFSLGTHIEIQSLDPKIIKFRPKEPFDYVEKNA